MQSLAEEHDTAVRYAPSGLGMVWIDQLDPSHTSANVPALEFPTDVQALADGHDTANSELFDAPAGVGVGWIDQLDPSHASASVPELELPTAVQALGDLPDTPASDAPGRVGHAWGAQLGRG